MIDESKNNESLVGEGLMIERPKRISQANYKKLRKAQQDGINYYLKEGRESFLNYLKGPYKRVWVRRVFGLILLVIWYMIWVSHAIYYQS